MVDVLGHKDFTDGHMWFLSSFDKCDNFQPFGFIWEFLSFFLLLWWFEDKLQLVDIKIMICMSNNNSTETTDSIIIKEGWATKDKMDFT